MSLNEEQQKLIMEMVSDPRYTQESSLQGLFLAATLKEAVLEQGLVENLNMAYGWNMPKDMKLSGKQTNDIIYDIVLKPGYSIEKFMQAVKSGKRL